MPDSSSKMGIQDNVIAARFFTQMGHLTAILVLISTIENNVEKGLEDGESSSAALASCNWALALGTIAMFFDFSGMFFGNSLFSNYMNMTQILFHATGSIFLSWLITQNWHYDTLWPIIICTNFPTAIIEVGIILAVYVFKISAL